MRLPDRGEVKNHREIYLDNNATTQCRDEVVRAIRRCLARGAQNPSSAHSSGLRARESLEYSRQQVANLLGCSAEHVLFTSGATEANNQALLSVGRRSRAPGIRTVVTTTIEHSSILETCEYLERNGTRVVRVGVDDQGRVRMRDLIDVVPSADLVSVQWANNETGVIQPVAEIATFCARHNVPFHSDGAQAIGKIPLALDATDLPLVSITSHKIHGPPGIGALYVRNRSLIRPHQWGGTQEQGLRPGTENLLGIVGFGEACELRNRTMASVSYNMSQLRDELEAGVLAEIPEASVNGSGAQRICNTTNIRFDGLDGQAMVAQLDAQGLRCSQTSACTNQRPEPSHVLRAMGLTEEEAWSSIRFSVSEFTKQSEVVAAVEIIKDVVSRLRHMGYSTTSRAS